MCAMKLNREPARPVSASAPSPNHLATSAVSDDLDDRVQDVTVIILSHASFGRFVAPNELGTGLMSCSLRSATRGR